MGSYVKLPVELFTNCVNFYTVNVSINTQNLMNLCRDILCRDKMTHVSCKRMQKN